MSSLVSELRRRNVFRVAATYALVAWIIIEAGSVLMPTFGAPDWVFQIYVIVVFAGFVLSLVFAWVFEVTPEGIKRDRDIEPGQYADRDAGQKKNIAIIGLLIIALAVSITLNVTGLRSADSASGESAGRRAVAVLPFESLSANPENTLFADGIHDDLLTKLANIGAFKVISRTSVMEYRGTEKQVEEIAAELDVDTILAGTVQRVGDNVRINMQLVDVSSGNHLWAQSYDRRLTAQDIFAIQSEISRSVSTALRSALSPEASTRLTTIPTNDLRAYSLYTAGKNNLYQRRRETLLQGQKQFEQAIEIDPGYAEAYAGLAQSILLLLINHQEYARDEAIARTRAALDKALELDPQLADAYAILGLLNQDIWSQFRTGNEDLDAEQAFEKALSLNPNHASAYMWYASLRDSQQRPDEAIELYVQSLKLDPLGRIPWSNLPGLYAQRGDNQEALDAWLQAVEIHPEWPTPYGYLATHLAALGRLDEALAWYFKARSLSTDPFIGSNIAAGIYYEFGEIELAKENVVQLPAGHPFAPLGPAFQTLIDGNLEEAMEYLDALIDSGLQLPGFVFNVASDVALLLADYEKSRRYALLEDPVLDSDNPLVVDRYTVDNIVKLAFIYRETGNPLRAKELAEESLPFIQNLPRLGMYGHGILDVEAYAILGRTEDALSAFEHAVNDGLRTTFMSNTWPVEANPYLQQIKDHPRFVAAQDRMEEQIQFMRARAMEADAAGTLDQLRTLASAGADAATEYQ